METDAPNEEKKPELQHFVVVLAYTSSDGEIEEEFGRMVQDMKALYSLRENFRAYACVEESAKNILALVEKPQE